MNKTPEEGVQLARELVAAHASVTAVDIVVCPPFTALLDVARALGGTPLRLGAQNVHPEAKGAYTGEVSVEMLRSVCCTHVIVGHSERRTLFGETDAFVNRKVKAALAGKVVPILCVGETLAEREGGRTLEVVRTQVEAGLAGVSAEEAAWVVIAYEPVWAIGTGRVATTAQAQEVHAFVRGLVSAAHGDGIAAGMRILYGGSMKPDNAVELLAQPDVDGGLIGGASLTAKDFGALVAAAVARA